ncbi:putative SnoaL-like polyketide cyclase [Colletotrichum sublineola]|uniref:Putative SnoaL-like polyketide cyclase n=1 Tax=Colletotrichum sublineola TaxID=1173701 RepID=A0A066X8Q6_COLSU|nr:putative SnoaL-like polyketide cyclase [Colletotrichum sublineola]
MTVSKAGPHAAVGVAILFNGFSKNMAVAMAGFHTSPETIFRGMIHDQNTKRWQDLESRLQPAVNVDGESLPRDRFRDRLLNDLAGDGDTKEVKIDAMLVDADTPSIAARLINRVVPAASKPFEYQEIVFANFTGSLVSTWKTVRDEDGFRSREPAHNDRELTIAEYIPLISDSQDAIDGLHFDIQDLFADEETQRIAARLEFTGTPVKEWGGARPNGTAVRFHEHVIYQLEQGKTSRVWSTIELDLYRKQMGKDAA